MTRLSPPSAFPGPAQKTTANWGVWRPYWSSDGDGGGYWKFKYLRYRAELSADMVVKPDGRAPTAAGKTMKSGYGVNQTLSFDVSTNQPSAVTKAQNAMSYFPEFQYKTYWRLLEQTASDHFEFRRNQYSIYNNRTHFVPIWYPDGSYTLYTRLFDCWTPDGMLSLNQSDSVAIQGSLWADWHIATVKPH